MKLIPFLIVAVLSTFGGLVFLSGVERFFFPDVIILSESVNPYSPLSKNLHDRDVEIRMDGDPMNRNLFIAIQGNGCVYTLRMTGWYPLNLLCGDTVTLDLTRRSTDFQMILERPGGLPWPYNLFVFLGFTILSGSVAQYLWRRNEVVNP